MSRLVSLSWEEMGTCCSATNWGSSGGGQDCVPDFPSGILRSAIVLNFSRSAWRFEFREVGEMIEVFIVEGEREFRF